MSERINIWGKPNCELPNGKLCNACCILPEIELEGNIVSVKKPDFTPCPNLSKNGQGCSLHKTENKPAACAWHCSQAPASRQIELISQAISTDIVSCTDADKAVEKIMRDTNTSVPLEFIIDDVHLNAERIKGNTMHRELVYADLDET